MADVARTRATLITDFADNTSGAITAQEQRDFVVSAYTPQAINGFRLTLTTVVPVTTSDVTGATTIYLTPYLHNCIGLYNGDSSWITLSSAEVSLALGTLTSGKNYDVFAYNSSLTLTLELSAAWTNDTTRADALTTQDGVLVKSGATTRRYVGTFRTTATTTTEDSGGGTTTQVGGKRFLWNMYNQVARQASVIDTTATWSYTTNTVRQANAASGNKIEYVVGVQGSAIRAAVNGGALLTSNSARGARTGVGIDSTTTISGLCLQGFNASGVASLLPLIGRYEGFPGIGYHAISWNEKGPDGSCSFYGSDTPHQSGLIATIWG